MNGSIKKIQWHLELKMDNVDINAVLIPQGARNEIFAMQPAPIQVSYMGFPGTTGANYIDYLVTDEVVPIFLFLFHVTL